MDDTSFYRIYSRRNNYDPALCDITANYEGKLGLRIASIFVVSIFSCIGVFFPLISIKIQWLKFSPPFYFFSKFFGTGIIIATALVHLLPPAIEELGLSPCLVGIWTVFNFSPIFIMVGLFSVFLLNLFSLRFIHMKYNKKPLSDSSTSETHTSFSIGNENTSAVQTSLAYKSAHDLEKQSLINKCIIKKNIISFLMLEFGIIFHSIIIGLTLAVTSNSEFITLFIVIVFHQFFEGFGLGARLFDIANYNKSFFNWLFASAYGFITPLSIATGLLLKTSYNPRSSTTLVVSGIFDSLSSGILLYGGIVELLAEDFIINPELRNGNLKRLLLAIFWVVLGFIVMSILGKWI